LAEPEKAICIICVALAAERGPLSPRDWPIGEGGRASRDAL
jgi:hypothetical protein